MKFGGDEGVEELLRRRGDDYWDMFFRVSFVPLSRRVALLMGWTGDWDFLLFLWELAEVLDEWKLATRLFIQPVSGMLKIS